MFRTEISKCIAWAGGAALLVTVTPAFAEDPLMGKSPWSFSEQNRAAIAIAIKNIEDPGAYGSAGAGTIICGGTSGASGEGSTGSGASATANSSCIIINNSDGASVHNDQISDGDQTSNSSASVKKSSKTKPKSGSGSIDEVSSILGGHKQGL